jgi:hypothetical protein
MPKSPLKPPKPHLYIQKNWQRRMWVCLGDGEFGTGDTLAEAYDLWKKRMEYSGFGHKPKLVR